MWREVLLPVEKSNSEKLQTRENLGQEKTMWQFNFMMNRVRMVKKTPSKIARCPERIDKKLQKNSYQLNFISSTDKKKVKLIKKTMVESFVTKRAKAPFFFSLSLDTPTQYITAVI